jgi:hypothetical protein
MARPTISSTGSVLNKKPNKKSRFHLRGTNLTNIVKAEITGGPYTWKCDVPPGHQHGDHMVIIARFVSRIEKEKERDTGDLTVTVTNNMNETGRYPLLVAFVDEDD